MRTMPAGSVDAVVTDPPYGVRYSPSQNSAKAWGPKTFVGSVVVQGDDVAFDPMPFLGFPVVVLFGGNHFADKLPVSSEWVIWDKRDGLPSNDFADCEMIYTNRQGVARIFRHRWNGALRDSEKGEPRVHPTQKPLELMMWLIQRYTLPGSIVFDPFMGSGTTGVACVRTGRNFIGCEIDPTYYAIAQRRIAEAQLQPPLFPHEATAQPEQLTLDNLK
jgi:site-specific DNA-methyltransferase (adenine-specific)/modification methylase